MGLSEKLLFSNELFSIYKFPVLIMLKIMLA